MVYEPPLSLFHSHYHRWFVFLLLSKFAAEGLDLSLVSIATLICFALQPFRATKDKQRASPHGTGRAVDA